MQEIIDAHIVNTINQPIRFVDYSIGLFPLCTTKNGVKKAIKNKRFYINKELAQTGVWMKEGDLIELTLDDANPPKPFLMNIEIVYEDDFLAVVNKPSGIVVSGNLYRTLENCLVDQLSISSQPDAYKWAKPVHRIDSSTSGLVIFAKTASANIRLSKLFENQEISKEYFAIVGGNDLHNQVINREIDGKSALTKLAVVQMVHSLKNGQMILVKLTPRTGRTHQLRIHCASCGFPIIGDKLYGEEGNIMNHKGLFLNANRLKFEHPFRKEMIDLKIEVPAKFFSLLEREERRWQKYN